MLIKKINCRFLNIGLLTLALASCSSHSDVPVADVGTDAQAVNVGALASKYLLGVMAEREGDLNGAANAYISALAEAPMEHSLKQRALAYSLASGWEDMDNALRLAKTLHLQDEPGSTAWIFLAAAYAKEGNYERALRYFERAQDGVPSLLHFKVLEAHTKLAKGESRKKVLKEMAEFESHTSLAAHHLYHLARLQARAGETEKALIHLEQAHETDVGSLLPALALGETLELQNMKTAAQQVYNEFLSKNADRFLLLRKEGFEGTRDMALGEKRTLEVDLSEAIFELGMLMWAQKLDIPALQLLNIAIWLDDNPVYHYYVGMVEEFAGRYERAVAHYIQIPTDHDVWVASQVRLIDVLFTHLNVQDDAVTKMLDLSALFPKNVYLKQNLAEMYYQEQDYAAAIPYFDDVLKALESQPEKERVSLYFARGASYERLQQYEKAEMDLEKALKIQPNNSTILNYLGYMWLDADMNLDKASNLVAKAALLRPNDGAILDSLGWVYYKKGQYAKALLYLERALQYIPDDPTVLEHLGDVYLKLGNAKRARQYWQESLDLGPVGMREKSRIMDKLGLKEAPEF